MIIPYPRVPHLPGSHAAPDDLVLDQRAADALLARELVVVEKLDGINVAVTATPRGVRSELRTVWHAALGGAVARAVDIYVRQRARAFSALLRGGRVLYGEWLWHRIAIPYDELEDAFVVFALRERRGRFLPSLEAFAAAAAAGLTPARPLHVGHLGSLAAVRALCGRSRYGRARSEGVCVEPVARGGGAAKWVEHHYRHQPAGQVSGARNRVAAP